MRAGIEKRLTKLEQNAQQDQQQITRIVLTAPGTDKEVVIFDAEKQSKPVTVKLQSGIVCG